jgi:hypothetical protein
MTDIIRQVEEKDSSNFVTCHIYITQFKENFDLRSAMVVNINVSWPNFISKYCSEALTTDIDSRVQASDKNGGAVIIEGHRETITERYKK